MNKCTFLGTVQYMNFDANDYKIGITLRIAHKRKSKNDTQILDNDDLEFEAWGGAAQMLYNRLNLGDSLLIIDSTARRYDENIRFRINEFKILNRNL